MALTRLDIDDFRNLVSVKLETISRGFNFIFGNNGSGKTSLLEAIYYLSLGRSFRSSVNNRIISNSADKFSLFANVASQANQSIPIGVERHQNGDVKIRISGKDARSTAELANVTPVLLINSNCYNLLDAPGFRRKYMDWGTFYVANDFLRIWRQYERALKQRNSALRGQISRRELDAWTQELIVNAVQLDRIRREYTETLFPYLNETLNELITIKDLSISYQPGWSNAASFQDVLQDSFERDKQLGYTQFGPHRADLKILINQVPAKDILSRGQQKLFVCAMILTQGAILFGCTNKKPIYLVDDLPSELDVISRTKLIGLLLKQDAQVFVTAVERETLEGLSPKEVRMFHVEHGKVQAVSGI